MKNSNKIYRKEKQRQSYIDKTLSESLMALALRKCIKQKKVNEKGTLNSKKIKTR